MSCTHTNQLSDHAHTPSVFVFLACAYLPGSPSLPERQTFSFKAAHQPARVGRREKPKKAPDDNDNASKTTRCHGTQEDVAGATPHHEERSLVPHNTTTQHPDTITDAEAKPFPTADTTATCDRLHATKPRAPRDADGISFEQEGRCDCTVLLFSSAASVFFSCLTNHQPNSRRVHISSYCDT